MLIVNSILGNMYKDGQLAKKIEDAKQQGKFGHLELSRTEMEKSRLRKKTADGLDVGFILEPGTKLNHGDVISKSDEIILIEQLPEKTLTVKFMENDKNLFDNFDYFQSLGLNFFVDVRDISFSIKEVNNSKYHHNSNYPTYHGAIVSIVSKRADGYGCIK